MFLFLIMLQKYRKEPMRPYGEEEVGKIREKSVRHGFGCLAHPCLCEAVVVEECFVEDALAALGATPMPLWLLY